MTGRFRRMMAVLTLAGALSAPPPALAQPQGERSALPAVVVRPLSTPKYTMSRLPARPLSGEDAGLITGSVEPPAMRAPRGAGLAETSGLRAAIQAAKAGQVNAGRHLTDPVARVLVEWVGLNASLPSLDVRRALRFIEANPGFPAQGRLRAALEAALFDGRHEPALVLGFFAKRPPLTAKGKLALAFAEGGRAHALALVREVWRKEDLTSDVEARIRERFGAELSRADHKARMLSLLLAGRDMAAQRMALRLGPADIRIAHAFARVTDGGDASGLLAQVPASAHNEPAFLYARARHLRQQGRMREAAQVMLAAPRDPALLGDGAEWSIERRIISRNLLDSGQAALAYRVVAGHGAERGAERIEAEFFAGFIALRFLKEPRVAIRHFTAARAAAGTAMSQSRGAYWHGRALEAAGQAGPARQAYGEAARFSSHYYGQLARVQLGLADLPVRRHVRSADFVKGPSARAVKLLYAAGERGLAHQILADLGQRLTDMGQIDAIGAIAAQASDVRGVLTLGKGATNRGLPFDVYAFPTMGIPTFSQVGPQIDKAVVYAIARQESTFDHKAVSHAGAKGLLQLLPATARQTARANGLSFSPDRLLSDPAYNAKLGAAHLGELVQSYRGSYILSFAAYNAGGGRVRDWIEAYGDPRAAHVDPIDWVERIPFAETRNYVQRVMENTQIYRARLSGGGLRIMADMRRGRS